MRDTPPLAKGVGMYSGELSLFKAVINSAAENPTCSDCWRVIDAELENKLEIEVIKIPYPKVFELSYNKKISPRRRFRENLGLGLNYKSYLEGQ